MRARAPCIVVLLLVACRSDAHDAAEGQRAFLEGQLKYAEARERAVCAELERAPPACKGARPSDVAACELERAQKRRACETERATIPAIRARLEQVAPRAPEPRVCVPVEPCTADALRPRS